MCRQSRRMVNTEERPTFSELLAEWAPWTAFVFVAGPPVIFLLLPLLVLVLSLVWVFALLFAVAAVFIAGMVAVGLASGLVASSRLAIGPRSGADGGRGRDHAGQLLAR